MTTKCKHSFSDKLTACNDGICPLCLAENVTRYNEICVRVKDENRALHKDIRKMNELLAAKDSTEIIGLSVGEGIFVDPSELKQKGFVGEIMWDIAFCNPSSCRDKEAYMELLEHTAEVIIEKVIATTSNG